MKLINFLFSLGLTIGCFSEVIFFLGLIHSLTPIIISITTIIFILFCTYLFSKGILSLHIKNISRVEVCVLLLISSALLVTLIGTFIPETAFDALWYHLTLPKLYILNQQVSYYPGGLLYYSAMPKVGELLYIPTLLFGGDILTHLVHFFFALLTCLTVYLFARRYMSKSFSLLAVCVLLGNIVVLWEGTTAYIDLIRMFYELSSFFALVIWFEEKKTPYLFLSAFLLGFAVQTKLLAVSSLFVILLLTAMLLFQDKLRRRFAIRNYFLYLTIVLTIPLPWFLFSLFHTSNPLYPFFTSTYPVHTNFSFFQLPFTLWHMFMQSGDPVSPIYLMLLPLFFLLTVKQRKIVTPLIIYGIGVIILTAFMPQTGGGRFILPYLPVLSIISAYSVEQTKIVYLKRMSVASIIMILLVGICYRGIAEARALPYLLGKESRSTYLTKHLNFSFGDFYDTDNYFSKHITKNDVVLLIGFHNLYYVNFPFIHESWVRPTDKFSYIAVQNTKLPKKYHMWKEVYSNPLTHVTLYAKQ